MRLIDADALKQKLLEERDAIPLTYTERYGFGVEFPSSFGQARRGGVKTALRCMEQTPTIDAVPVVHGRWVWDVETHGDPMYGVDEDFGYRCSECKVWADEYGVDGDIYEEPPTHILRYCPNCGARMDGDG